MGEGVIQHRELAASGRWAELSFAQQMANIGSEIYRAGSWKDRGREDRAVRAADRALELIDFTVDAMLKKKRSPRELLRLREVVCDYFYGDNQYLSSSASLNHYFDPFAIQAARERGV